MADAEKGGEGSRGLVLGGSSGLQVGSSNTVVNSIQPVSIAMPCYLGLLLQKGDNDAKKKWGGNVSTEAGEYVADLQKDLITFAVFTGSADGDFGGQTEDALKRFQWVAKNIKKRVVSGKQVKVEITFSGSVTGKMDDATCTEMKLWKEKHYIATGNLVKVNVDQYSEFQRGTLSSVRSDIKNSEMVLDAAFASGLAALNAAAKSNSVKISVNQVFRVQGAVVSGAVVQPATKSQHLIGHAIDTNMVDGATVLTSASFKAGTETDVVKKFISDAKAAGLRWGGDFGKKDSTSYDPPHFDLQVDSSSDEYNFKFFFNQRQLSENHPILIPD